MSADALVLGVDGRRGGWAVAIVRGSSRRARLERFDVVDGPASALFDLALGLGASAVGMDVPIGLPRDDWRDADRLAKQRLGRASARVFLVPPRSVYAATDYAEARLRCRAVLGGRGLSAQTWGIRGPVVTVDAALLEDPWAREHVVETHPELSFARLGGAVLAPKRTAQGRSDRLAALAGWLNLAGQPVPRGDDHLDAVACAYSALRWVEGVAEILGGTPDERGLPQRIVI
ncbi:MAG: DUF429 domain-containing protein [Janthinobacterium lividum]